MIASKFGIGQQVRHSLLGYLGVVVDIDAEYSLEKSTSTEMGDSDRFHTAPWYHVVMEDNQGQAVHSYLAEAVLSWEPQEEHPEHPSMDDLAASIRQQLQAPSLRN